MHHLTFSSMLQRHDQSTLSWCTKCLYSIRWTDVVVYHAAAALPALGLALAGAAAGLAPAFPAGVASACVMAHNSWGVLLVSWLSTAATVSLGAALAVRSCEAAALRAGCVSRKSSKACCSMVTCNVGQT